MIIDVPALSQIPALRALWQQAFGDTDAFLDSFFSAGFSPARCRCITLDGTLAAALYWFDCQWEGTHLAYLYAVATEESQQGKGLCRTLMEDTHSHLRHLGYGGAVLVPGSPGLFRLYEKLGYKPFGGIREFSCTASSPPVTLRPVTPAEYAALRRSFLPAGSVLQEGAFLNFLATQAVFYAGADLLLCAAQNEKSLFAYELLGDPTAAPGILAALGAEEGRFRTLGDAPFAMHRSFTDEPQIPTYFAFALD